MASMPSSTVDDALAATVLQSLHSKRHLELLNVIDSLRAQGLNEHVALPQLIVSGDQSSGKSSVLEAISGVPFPKKENLCTRFATEVILRRNDKLEQTQIDVSLMPGSSRSAMEKASFKAFQRHMGSITELPQIMEEATKMMGLGNMGSSAFATDILRMEVRGPRLPQLTIVDLPGLIHSENTFQSAEDVKLVTRLVEQYMAQERTIILAIVSAKNDYANQIVLTKARAVDPKGRRTLGIITKPDAAYPGSAMETAFVHLARNQAVKFSLGWHVVRNLDSNEVGNIDRDAQEAEFFRASNWTALDAHTKGIDTLRARLSEVLFQQIKNELPSLLSEIASALVSAKLDLSRMGRSRNTDTERRLFVVELGQKFHALCHAACEGDYENPFFGEIPGDDRSRRRLRAIVQNRSSDFRTAMLQSSHEVYTSSKACERAKELNRSYRGKEPPGTFNPLLIGHLFKELSARWLSRTQQYVQDVWCRARIAISEILDSVSEEHVRDTCLSLIVDPQLASMREKLEARLADYMGAFQRHAITYNHYLTEKVQERQKARQEEKVRLTLEGIFAEENILRAKDARWVAAKLSESTEPDMDEFAAQQLTDYAEAYLTVAMKRVNDEVPAHVVEPTIMTELPKLLNSVEVFKMSEALIEKIAGESSDRIQERKRLEAKVSILEKSRLVCEVHAASNDSGPFMTPDSSTASEDLEDDRERANTVEPLNSLDAVYNEPPAQEVPDVEVEQVEEVFPEPPGAPVEELNQEPTMVVRSLASLWGQQFNEPKPEPDIDWNTSHTSFKKKKSKKTPYVEQI